MAKKENKNEIKITIEGEAWSKAIDKAFTKKNKEGTIDGVRKGKAPRDVFEKKYGKESLFLEASDFVIEEAYLKALDDSKLIPVVQPKVDVTKINDKEIEFKFNIITKHEVKIKKYKDLKVKKGKVEVTKEEINHELSHLLEKYTEISTKETGK